MTKAHVIFRDGTPADSELVCVAYINSDGYPSGVGAKLANFLLSKVLVNGLSSFEQKYANGMGCLAASYIAEMKHGPGGIYLTGTERHQYIDFYYTVYGSTMAPQQGVTIVVEDHTKDIFQGNPPELHVFCDSHFY